jgi:transketolase
MVWLSLKAAEVLEAEGISVEVINMHTIKPLDEAAILASVKKTGCVVTAEEHMMLNGLGDAVAQVLTRNYPAPQEYIAVNDTFGESGKPEELLPKYGLGTDDIVAALRKVMARKS